MSRKKVLFIITKSNYGGAQKYVYDLAAHLPPEEFDVSVAAGGDGILFEKLQKAGVRTLSLPRLSRDVSIFSDVSSFFSLYRLFKKERPDIIHLNSSKAGFVGALAARCLSVVSFLSPIAYRLSPRIIFTAHGWPFHEDRSFLVRGFFFLLAWKTVVLSHRTIAVSEYVKQAIGKIPFARKKVTVISPGVAPTELLPRDEAREQLLGHRAYEFENVPWIGTIAELHRNKDIQTTLRALHLLSDIPFVFVVIGEGEERDALERKIQYLNLSENVFLVGFKDNAAKLLSAFDLFTLSSTTEAFGYVVVEALQAGVPVISTAAGGVPEIIEKAGRGETVPVKDYRALAAQIKNTLENKDPINPPGVLYPIEEMVKQTADCYQSLTS